MATRFDEFKVTEQHLTLLRNANVSWDGCEFGAPAIDCKRPYGNSDAYGDMLKLLNLPAPDDDGEIPDETREWLYDLHVALETALQVVLSTGQFKPGRYRAPKYTRNWEPAPPPQEER